PLKRSKRTAAVIWDSREEEILTDSDLREIDLYSFQGLLKHEGIAKIDEAFCMWQKDAPNYNIDGHYPTPSSPIGGGSSAGRKASKRIVLVCHGSSQASSSNGDDTSMDMLGTIQ
ncbi:probable 2-carboxy-D-arabinitol-1-phosphatase, partial [Tanacetum coccineum]